jgi:hypothetical protein
MLIALLTKSSDNQLCIASATPRAVRIESVRVVGPGPHGAARVMKAPPLPSSTSKTMPLPPCASSVTRGPTTGSRAWQSRVMRSCRRAYRRVRMPFNASLTERR